MFNNSKNRFSIDSDGGCFKGRAKLKETPSLMFKILKLKKAFESYFAGVAAGAVASAAGAAACASAAGAAACASAAGAACASV